MLSRQQNSAAERPQTPPDQATQLARQSRGHFGITSPRRLYCRHTAKTERATAIEYRAPMQVSEDAGAIVQEIRQLREERERRLQCDLHFIDAEYDRRLRRIQAGVTGGTSLWSCSVANALCLRRRCRCSLRRMRNGLVRRASR